MLTGKGLGKAFGKNQVLDGIDVEVTPGKITAIIGPSGGGKSTLIRAMSLLDPPDIGTITIDGVTFSFPRDGRNAQKAPWPLVTVVFQQLFLWPHLTLRRNITLPLEQHNPPASSSRVNELLALFDLEAEADKYPNETSLGQRQRAALIRALVLEPRYLLLDEITSALDVEHVSRVLDQLQAVRARGTGILLVTHLIGFARQSADHVIFMENGAIVESGGPSVLSRPQSDRLTKFLSLVETAA